MRWYYLSWQTVTWQPGSIQTSKSLLHKRSSLWVYSVLWRSMSPVCVFCPLQVHVSTWCSELAPSLSQTTNYCLPIFCIFLYISIFFYFFLYFLYFSVIFCSLCIACQFPDKDKMHRIKNILSSQLCLMTEHWRGSNLPNIYTVQYVTIANHQQKNANTPKCQISSNSGGSRAAVACRQFTRLSTKLPSLTGYNGLYLLSWCHLQTWPGCWLDCESLLQFSSLLFAIISSCCANYSWAELLVKCSWDFYVYCK